MPPAEKPPAGTTTEQLAALTHPMRNRLLFAVGSEGATVSQLAARLKTNKGNVAHHLSVLQQVGLVHVSRTRTVRGGTERYFARTQRKVRSTGNDREVTAATLQAVSDEIGDSPHAVVHLRRIRLTRAQAAALAEHLDRFVSGLTEAPRGEPTHGVLVSVFQSGSRPTA